MNTHRQPGVLENSTIFFHTPSKRIPDFFYYPIRIGHYFCVPPYKVTRTRYDNFLFLYTKRGKGTVSVNGAVQELFPGDVCLLDCYRPHEYYTDGNWEILWMHYDGGNAREFFEYLTNRSFFKISMEKPEEFENGWEEIYDQFVNQGTFCEALVSRQIYSLLTTILLEKEKSEGRMSADYIDDTLQYINRHLSEDMTLEFLAQRVSLSMFHFARRFKEETGYTPYRYIYTSRINLARFYLKTTQDTVKEVGYRCGFKSEHSFCTAFKNETGQTPSQYRRG